MRSLAFVLASLASAIYGRGSLRSPSMETLASLKGFDTTPSLQMHADMKQEKHMCSTQRQVSPLKVFAVLVWALSPTVGFNPSQCRLLSSRVGNVRNCPRGASARMQVAQEVLPPRISAPRLVGRNGAVGSPAGLKLLNSLSQQKEPFVPINENFVKWYVCGPTVYDAAHVGHARNYVAFDIVRRVLIQYFGFDILYVMNITDIDDKIILRTHFNHLKAMVTRVREILAAAAEADKMASLREAQATAEETLALLKPGLKDLLAAQHDLADASAAAGVDGVAVCDVQKAFLELTTAYESDFFADMEALGVMPPDAITRVSDYVSEVIAYIERIMANGFCYEAGGSVYFDTAAYSADPSKIFGKLDPSKITAGQTDNDWTEGKTTAELLAEGEGALSAGSEADKRDPADFVLWKASKEGEPAWDSPWGRGRPGWHIECSAMASDLLGCKVDLNSGGIDLKFPHHENQIAQSEAYFNCCEGESWVNYFLHSGHLQIAGRKMSKSLKNFITIKGALSEYSANQIRFLFLMRGFSDPMEYSENTMNTAVDLERRFNSFDVALATRLKECAASTAAPSVAASDVDTAPNMVGEDAPSPPLPEITPLHKWGKEERTLQEVFDARRAEVHQALCDSIDTASAIKAMEQIIRATNVYMNEVPEVSRGGTLLASVSRYYSRIMGAFGIATSGAGDLGAASGSAAGITVSSLEVAEALSEFRDSLRQKAIATIREGGGDGSAAELSKQILSMCDALRDETLPPLGIQVDDRGSGKAQVQMGDPKVLMAEAERKAEMAAEANAKKAAKEAAKAAAAMKEAERAKVPLLEYFDPKHDKLFEREESYGALDEDGIPTEDAAGEALSKRKRKKLIKELEKHGKLLEKA